MAEKEKIKSRAQKRYEERFQHEVLQVLESLHAKFLHFFTNADNPEGQEVIDYRDKLSRQWRLFASRKKLNPEGFTILDEYMDSLLKEYLAMKEAKKEPSEILP